MNIYDDDIYDEFYENDRWESLDDFISRKNNEDEDDE